MPHHDHAALMSIPVQADHDLAAISQASDLVLLKCRIIRHSPSKDRPRLRLEVKELLRAYNDLCLDFADGCCDGR
jgi:hypothetical protein